MQVPAYPHEGIAALFKAVSDPTRVRILATIVFAGELCVCHVEKALGLSQSRVSRHLTALRRAGLLIDRRDGAWTYYSIPRRTSTSIRSTIAIVRKAMESEPELESLVARAIAVRDGQDCGVRR
ncbi:MAG: metalloregulator ArsR/SmtB family transcription factor [Planctomycetes bacterium]|nr:metalloregulator ArsR/SmtB family transcription factor [Planctomycetota bacterium]